MARNRPESPAAIDERSITAEQEKRERARAAAKRWRESHRDEARLATRNWQEDNPEEVRAQKRRWYDKHREKIKAKNKAHYHNNRDKVRAARKRVREGLRKYVTAEELAACRTDPREAMKIKGPAVIVCLECGVMLETLSRHLMPEHRLTAAQYKEKWGYNRNTALMCESLRPEFSRMAKSFGRRGTAKDQQVEKLVGMLPAARRTPKRLEYRLDRSDKHQGKARPDLWKQSPDRGLATDWRIVELHLAGNTRTNIARAVGLKYGESVGARLMRIGFPSGRPCVYDRGAQVTGHHLWDLSRDVGLRREELAQRLGVSTSWLSNHMSPSRVERTLSVEMAKVVLAVRRGLIDDWRKRGATQKGGRPRVLLPSEKESLPGNYRALRQELKLLRQWLLDQPQRPSIAEAWAWVCAQSRQGKLRRLLFWPQFLKGLKLYSDEGFFLEGTWVPNELAIQFLATEYDVSEETVRRLAYGFPKKRTESTARTDDPVIAKLLDDIRIVFGDRLSIPSAELVSLLNGLAGSSWQQLGMTPLNLADHLRPLGVRSRNLRIADSVVKGYTRDDFVPLWPNTSVGVPGSKEKPATQTPCSG